VPFTGLNAVQQVVFTGTLVEAVVSEQGTSTLDFYYAIVNDGGSRQGITTVASSSFTGLLTDVDSLADSGGDVGSTSATRDFSGGIVQFNFANSVLPGQASNFVFIKTDSSTFGAGTVVLMSNDGMASVKGFAPVPEPTSILLLGVGVLVLVVWRCKHPDVIVNE
jgi:hypothetical protein